MKPAWRAITAAVLLLGMVGLADVRRASGSEADEERRASYGLVQLQGVRDGASVDLDGRFWLTAAALDRRWLALPEGTHTIAVRARGAKPVERRVDVKPGTTRVVRFPG